MTLPACLLIGEDISHNLRVEVAWKETIRLMPEIDKFIPEWPINKWERVSSKNLVCLGRK
jgi:hypothetical protein